MKDLTSSVYNFEKLRQNDYLYVDKTEYIWKLIHPAGESYFLSRPRRFGKSLTLSTLKAVFEGKKELFKGLAIYDKPYDWKPYPVVHLNFGNCDAQTPEELRSYLASVLKEAAKNRYENILADIQPDNLAVSFEILLNAASRQGNVVVLIDEYDKPILNTLSLPESQDCLKVLKGFYSTVKKCESILRFAFITGVSKFSHVSLFSDLNNLTDITMDARFAAMLGYTQEELEANFSDRLEALAGNQDIEEVKKEIKAWYNGYRFHPNAPTVYNPVSLAKFFESGGEFNNYWFSTGTPSFLMELIKRRHFDFEKVLHEPVSQIAFEAYEVENLEPLTLLLQTGYMTIKSSIRQFGQTWYYLDFPNREVAGAFSAYILKSYTQKDRVGVVQFTAEIARSLLAGDLVKLRKIMEVFFAGIPYNVHKKNEATFQAIFFALFRLLGEFIEAESCTNDGRIDAVVQTSEAIYLFEFKMDNDPTALEQIKTKEYFQKFLLDPRKIHLIGVNFDSEKGNLIGWQNAVLQGGILQ